MKKSFISQLRQASLALSLLFSLIAASTISVSALGLPGPGSHYGTGPGWPFSATISSALPAATLVTPTGNIGTNYTPTYTWNQVTGSTWYQVQVNGPSGVLIRQWYTSAQTNCNGTTCSITPALTLAGGAAYIWWVQTYDATGNGPWSAGMNFSTDMPAVLGAPTQVSPTGSNGTNNTPTYTWNDVAGSTWFRLQVNGPSGVVIRQWYTSAQAGCNGTTCALTPSTALNGGEGFTLYTWWVQGYNSGGNGPWSTGMTFTNAVPPANDLIANATAVSTTSFKDNIPDVSSGNPITVQGGASPDDPGIPNCRSTLGTTLALYTVWYSYTPTRSGNLEVDTLGSNYDTVLAVWSGTPASSPSPQFGLVAVACNDDSNGGFQSQLNSVALQGGTQYFIEVGLAASFVPSAPAMVAPLTANPIDNLVFNFQFTPTPLPAPTQVSPSGSIGTNFTPTYTWNQVTGSTWYRLQVNGPSGVVIRQWYTSAQAGCNGTTCSLAPTTLTAGTYTWWVQGYDSTGNGLWSPGMTFTIP